MRGIDVNLKDIRVWEGYKQDPVTCRRDQGGKEEGGTRTGREGRRVTDRGGLWCQVIKLFPASLDKEDREKE